MKTHKDIILNFLLKKNLAEKGERLKQYSDVYDNISKLAVYFDNENVQWLAHHFYTRALDVAKKGKFVFYEYF